MTNDIDLIKEIFSRLSDSDKSGLLQELQKEIKHPITVVEFAQLVQRLYKENIKFTIDAMPSNSQTTGVISAELVTPFGNFIGTGSNQIIAKQKAVEKGFEAFNKIHSGTQQ